MVAEKLLYHYCSTQTGLAILQSRMFRLSALSAANDSMEGRLLGRVFGELLCAAGVAPDVVDVASVIVEGYPNSTEGFAFCLSERGDILSQWRAYGLDGTGVSIGFSSEFLERDFGQVNFGAQFFELKQICYGDDQLRRTLQPFADEVAERFARHGNFVRLNDGVTREYALSALDDRERELEGLFKGNSDNAADLLSQLLETLVPLHFKIYDTKPSSFEEEREWRLVRYRHRVALPEVEYFANQYSIKPYISCLIADPAREAIREVVLGPKHTSKPDWVRAFLASVGLSHVAVKRSEIKSYR
ncbi:DUF2971 domain-containing protein [Phaeobacter italicus]|uniref:DUF2971 domain-containing protein n=1 Tax=Phaeobacter italicus TaxID=481446 RepID=UPI001ADA091A|nr:DUF2971 domain-containing protein [Phaeobacter italicus]MBO9441161.1 DUF2971 domain-containing protein [Phaeobacter italicus]